MKNIITHRYGWFDAYSSSALCLNCNLYLYSGTHKKTEPEANASDSVFLLISAATYSPTNTLRSTIGEGGLNCRVRHGTGCVPSSITTKNLYVLQAVIFAFFPAFIFVRLRSTYFHTPSLDSLDKLGKTHKSLRLTLQFSLTPYSITSH